MGDRIVSSTACGREPRLGHASPRRVVRQFTARESSRRARWLCLNASKSAESEDRRAFATPVHNLQAATDAFARLLASAESAVAAAEKEPTPRTVRATRDLNPDRPQDLLTWGRDRRSMSVGTAPVRPARGPREHAPSPQPRRVTRNVVVSPTTVVDAARIQRARMLGELCYTIPGSENPADRKRAERFATQYLGVTA